MRADELDFLARDVLAGRLVDQAVDGAAMPLAMERAVFGDPVARPTLGALVLPALAIFARIDAMHTRLHTRVCKSSNRTPQSESKTVVKVEWVSLHYPGQNRPNSHHERISNEDYPAIADSDDCTDD